MHAVANISAVIEPPDLTQVLITSNGLTVKDRLDDSKCDPILEHLYRPRSFGTLIILLSVTVMGFFFAFFVIYGLSVNVPGVSSLGAPVTPTTFVFRWVVIVGALFLPVSCPIVIMEVNRKLR